MSSNAPRLTELAHGGGCGCKVSPAVLRQILSGLAPAASFANLLIGSETSDDAAVWRLNDEQAVVATTDFFMPVVDDPFDFGRIAATNALSDVYAMGAAPIFALAIVGMPLDKLDVGTIRLILQGGATVCAAAGIPVAGGHSIDSAEPIYGLVVLGLVHPAKILTNRAARPGDAIVLTKGLGVGVLSAALKQNRLGQEGYATLIAAATRLNDVGRELGDFAGVQAVTDVTGFGLLGHVLEMCRGAGLSAKLSADKAPLLAGVEALARHGVRTGASERNWQSYAGEVELPANFADWRRDVLTDPQTSGGLVIAVDHMRTAALLDLVHSRGFAQAAEIGAFERGPARVKIT